MGTSGKELAMDITPKALSQIIENVAGQEPRIRQTRIADVWDIDDTGNQFPVLLYQFLPSTVTTGSIFGNNWVSTYSIEFYLAEYRREDFLNVEDALSDCHSILIDFLKKLASKENHRSYGVTIPSDISTEFVLLEGRDEVIAVKATALITVQLDACTSQLPLQSITATTSTCGFISDPVTSNVFSQNGTLLNSGSTPADGTFNYTVPNTTIANEAPTQLYSVDASETLFTIPNMSWTNSDGQNLTSFLAAIYVEDQTAPDIVVTNTNGGEEITLALSGNIYHPFSASSLNVKVYNSDADVLLNTGITSNLEFTVDDCTINLVSNGGSPLVSTISVPAGTTDAIVIPDFTIINSNGQSASSVSYSATVHVDFTFSGGNISYQKPWNNQYNSYDEVGTLDNSRPLYDEGWHMRNGSYTFEVTGDTMATLDTTDPVPYTAITANNIFGNKYRFTNSAGTQDMSSSYIIDHLTGLGWRTDSQYNSSQGADWEAQLSGATDSTLNGFDDWRVATCNEMMTIIPLMNSGLDPYFTSASNWAYTSTTDPSDLDNAISSFVGQHFYKTTKNSTGRRVCYVRNHFKG